MLTSSSCNTRLSPHQEPSQLASARWEGTDLQPGRSEAKTREIIKADKSAERSDFLSNRLALLDTIIQASIDSKQHSNAVGALKLQVQLTRLLEGS